MHLTASVIIQDEESGLHHDIMHWAEQLAPENPGYLHHQVVLPITNGRIDFGPWQRLFYCEFDGQRTKRVIIKVIGE
jgi:thiamine phosphate synthase YjbQ (UPF0047 family)